MVEVLTAQVQRCAGIDIGKKEVKVCLLTPGKRRGSFGRQVRTFATTTGDLGRMRDWLQDADIERVVMESTGQYWRPVFYTLEDLAWECWLVNPQHLKAVAGRKSDVIDCQWAAQMGLYGLVRASFVPPPPIRRLRDLTRLRTSLVRDRTRHEQRLHDVMEDAMIKLGVVASEILGKSSRLMIEALIAGERDPQVLAALALGRLRAKTAALHDALTGRFTAHHGFECRLLLTLIDGITGAILDVDTRIAEEIESWGFGDLLARLDTIPGIDVRLGQILIAETGGDMSRFPTPGHLSSWAGLCPGNNESAGKHKSTKTRKGDRWLAGALSQAAFAAQKSKQSHLAEFYSRIIRKKGKPKAVVATARKILEIAWHIMSSDTATYTELGPDYALRRSRDPQRQAERLTARLQALGYNVTLTKNPDQAA